MDLGLGNLVELKRQLLAESLRAQSTYDSAIEAIGQGVAAMFDSVCNRQFSRAVGATETFKADRDHWFLSRYPFESITTVEQRDSAGGGWVELTGAIENQDESSGLIYFAAELGYFGSLIRVTYTGGYWYDTSEDEDGELPAGATQVPADLKLAWFTQCQQWWDMRDKLGVGIGESPEKRAKLATLDLVPTVRSVLEKYTRMQLT